ncbi:proteasome assembly chaperone family protein [Acidianus brierleyi]|uniref:Carboxylate--amine ligase n=1 Tax=Acidianus brierleyi TaxID=41673 RepID=A0A2U9IES0_9CREN|nr:PAC2 family protein [Acidianus brierleyi]AWR94444.1 proteasome assembly chaperone family protein [Acidianus brierleyi]
MGIILKGISESELKHSFFITGFRTLGEVGYLATRHIVLKRRMQRIGFITTKYLNGVTFLDEYGIVTPFELFYDKEYNVIVELNHILPVEKEWNVFSRKIVNWVKKLEIKNAILIGGLDKNYKTSNEKLKWMKTSKSDLNLQYPELDKQLIMVGPLALFTIYSEIKDVPATVILPYSDKDRIDPAAAAAAVEAINKIVGFDIAVDELYEDAKKIEEEIRKQLEYLQKEANRSGLDRHYM